MSRDITLGSVESAAELVWHGRRMIGTLSCIIIDCPDPRALAPFYEGVMGLTRVEDAPDWVTLGAHAPTLALQRVADFVRPVWRETAQASGLHLDVLVDDLDLAEEGVLSLGATLLEGSDKPIGYRVYADPVGHPFCLVTHEALA